MYGLTKTNFPTEKTWIQSHQKQLPSRLRTRFPFFVDDVSDFPSRHTTSFQRLYDVYTTSATSYRRRINVETTSCIYWVYR